MLNELRYAWSLSIFQLYRGGPILGIGQAEKITDLSQVTEKL
jgi:hypothetical protein